MLGGPRSIWTVGLWVLIGAAGCRARPPLGPSGLEAEVFEPACRSAAPSLMTPELDGGVGALSESDSPSPRDYCLLTESECRRMAAASSAAANRREVDLLIAADAAVDQRGRCDALAMLQRDLLAAQIEEQRNQSAAEAMDAFYSLLEIEQEALRLEESLQQTKAMKGFVSEAKAQGIVLPMDESLPARRTLELLQRRAEIDLLRRRTNGRLQLLLGWDPASGKCIWPAADLRVAVEETDLDEACAAGVAQRHDLIQLRLLRNRISPDTLPLVRAVLAQADRTPMATPASLRALRSDRDLWLREEQIEHLLAQRQRAAVAEISEAVTAVEAHLRQAFLAQEIVQHWRDRVAQLERQHAAGTATVMDVGLARLEAISAQMALLHEVVQWKLSRTRLASVQGLLGAERDERPDPGVGAPAGDDEAPKRLSSQ